jgi:ubiquinol-cytochrome c reductase cytochrome c1 subunit
MIATRAPGNPFMSRSILSIVGAAALALALAPPLKAQEEATPAGDAVPHEEGEPAHYPIHSPEPQAWTFAGLFGKFDTAQLQRGYQVYREVCANCHSMNLVAFRHLGQEGGPHFTDPEVRALAAEFQITDGPDDAGDMFQRPGRPSDYFPSPFPNDQAAAAANGGAVPPDLSLMAKARGIPRGVLWATLDFFTQYQEGGPDYIHALLTGYQDPPAGVTVPEGGHYNPYFAAGPSLAMPKPLADGQVTYSDGTPGTVDQYSRDVSAFLMWAAEPHLTERKRIGFQVFIFLIVFAGLLYMTKQKVWAGVAH